MKIFEKIKDRNFLINFLFAVEAFLSINPYILWETYNYYKYFDIIKKGIEILLIILIISKGKIKIDPKSGPVCLSFCIVYLYYTFNTYDHKINVELGMIMKLIIISLFFTLPTENKKSVFRIFLNIFAISLVPAIIYNLFNIIGIQIKCDYIQSTQAIKNFIEQHYKHYFGCVFRESIYYSPRIKQLCGMYDEPGLVGTISALLLCACKFDFKRYKSLIIILIGGCMSMSLAFFMLCAIYYIYYCFSIKNKKQLNRIILVVLLFLSVIFVLRDNPVFKEKVIERFSLSYLTNNNRVSDEFAKEFEKFLSGNNIFFGLGNGNPIFDTVDAASYKVLIYNIGIIGFLLLIGWFLYWGIVYSQKNKSSLIFALIFLISIYQRPWIIYMYYILIYFGGIEISKEEKEIIKEEEK